MSKDTKTTLKDLVNGIKDKFAAAMKADPTLGPEIEKLHVLLAEEVTPPAGGGAATPPAFKEVKTKDGKILSIEGELKAGAKANLVDAGGTATPAPDGPYELEDGSMLTVTGGLITDVKAPAAATTPAVPDPTMMAKMAAFEKENNELKTKLSDSEKNRGELVAVFKKILETPIDAKLAIDKDKDKDEVTEEQYEKMTPLQRRKYWRTQK